ncbi:MAG: cytochrome c1 [Pseudomonadota bacterium]
MLTRLSFAFALATLVQTGGGFAAGDSDAHVDNIPFSFDGPFGSYDQNQLQRGLQVYTEVCSACHGLKFVPIRSLADEGGPHLPEDQVRAYASDIIGEVWDPTLFDGEGDYRPATETDHFPASGLANAPDLSLMAKARAGFHGPMGTGINQFLHGMGGPDYIVSLLTGYTGEEKEEAGTILYENTAFPGGWISMAPPLYGEDVEYADGHANDIYHISEDVAAFLMWTAEPKLEARKQMGMTAVVFLSVLTVLLYLTNKRLWAPVKQRAKGTPAE